MANGLLPQLPGYETLNSMYMAPMSGMMAQGNYDLAGEFAKRDYEKTTLDNELAKQLNPIKVQKEQADLGTVLQNNRKLTRENDFADEFLPQQKAAEIRKWALAAGDDDKKLYTQSVESMMRSTDPKVRKMGQDLYTMMPEIWNKDRTDTRDHKQKLEELDIQGKNQRAVASIYASNKGSKTASGGDGTEWAAWSTAFNKAKKASEKMNMLTTEYGRRQALDPNDPKLTELAAMANAIKPYVEEEMANNAAGDLVKGPDGKWGPRQPTPVQPTVPLGPSKVPQRQAAPQQSGFNAQQEDWITRALAANKGMTREQVIQYGKAKGKL